MTICDLRLGRAAIALTALLCIAAIPATQTPIRAAEDKPKSAPADKPYQIAWGPYLQNLTPQSVTVVWCDAGGGEEVLDYGQTAEQLGQTLRVRAGEATISGLQPGKTYFYRVTSKPADGRAAVASAVASFTTSTEDVKGFSFAVLADTHQSKYAPDLAKRILAERPDFVLHGGDRNPPAGGLIKPYKPVMQQIPMYLARGNHDSEDQQRRFSAMPGPGDRQYYWFRWGNARFFCVNTEDRKGPAAGLKKGGKQYEWLEQELQSCKETWKFVFQHIPVYSAYDGDMTPDLDDERALLEQYGVDVVFQGHQHNYDRSKPLRNKAVAKDKEKGVIYVTASGGCGGNEKLPKGEDFWFIEKTWRGEPFIGVCKIDGQRATVRFLTAAGQVFDSFDLQAR